MRKTMTWFVALALLVGFSGFAMAGGGDGFCTYSNKKHEVKVDTQKKQPVVSKTDKAATDVALADVDKTPPATNAKK